MPEELKLSKKDFSVWYDRILAYADIIDDRYPLKGVYVWKPYGYKALKLMLAIMERLLDKTGHEESYFPLFVPASLFSKEADFLRGFKGSALRVKSAGDTPLEEELIVRPTSETIMYPMFALWIRSYRDLPLKIYQTVPIFRWETKMTKPLLRVREIVKFKEAHTVHATSDEAEKQIKEAIGIYAAFFDSLKIPYVILRTPDWETFSGALYNYDFFTIMPDGKALELGSVINLGTKFSKTFGIGFLDENGKKNLVWQTCYGISERALGAALAVHGDNNGLIFVTDIAPIQVVIVPILSGEKEDKKIIEYAEKIKKMLDVRTSIDFSKETPGSKFHHWEAKGVPIRVEIGKREIKEKKLVVVRRDKKEKLTIHEKDLKKEIPLLLEKVDSNIYESAQKFFHSMIHFCKTIEEAEKILNSRGGVVKLPWCGREKCGKDIEERLVGTSLGIDEHEKVTGKCVICGKDAKYHLNFGRTY